MGLIPGSGRSFGVGNGYPLQYSCLENSIDRGTWWVTVHEVAKNRTRLSTHTHRWRGTKMTPQLCLGGLQLLHDEAVTMRM